MCNINEKDVQIQRLENGRIRTFKPSGSTVAAIIGSMDLEIDEEYPLGNDVVLYKHRGV